MSAFSRARRFNAPPLASAKTPCPPARAVGKRCSTPTEQTPSLVPPKRDPDVLERRVSTCRALDDDVIGRVASCVGEFDVATLARCAAVSTQGVGTLS